MSIISDLLKKYRANGFAEFRGLHIEGKIPVAQEVINEVIAELLRQNRAMPTGHEAAQQPSTTPLNVQELAHLVRRAEITAADGKVTLDFELGL